MLKYYLWKKAEKVEV